MKKLIIIITLFLTFLNCSFAADVKTVTKDYKIVTNDGFIIAATLKYPKVKEQKVFSTVVLLHSLGYSSQWWEKLPQDMLNQGYAVISLDFRGHGKSIYNPRLTKVSWKSLTNKAYAKFPDDVISVISYIKDDNKRVFFDKWAMVGSDLGANTAIYTANKIAYKPQTIVMISPVVNAKGLYIPVKLAELNDIDILSITGTGDINGEFANNYLKKFAQSTYSEYTSESTSTGMLLLKNDSMLSAVITGWINQYLK